MFKAVLNSRILRFAGQRAGLLWIFGVAAVCHLLFSRLGYSPNDDGFYLAASRRIFVEGQFPYLDFIWAKVPLTPVIQAPALLFGDYALYFSRFMFWLQNAAIAWFSVSALARGNFSRENLPVQAVCFLSAVAFFLNINTFMTAQWETYDALLFLSLGLYMLSVSRNPRGAGNFAAFAVMGLSYLCKHSFIFAVVGFLLVLGGARNPRNWLGAAFPGLLFLAVLAFAGALGEAYHQLSYFGGNVEVQIGQMRASSSLLRALNESVNLWGQTPFFLAGLVSGAVLFLSGHRKPLQTAFVAFAVFAAFWSREGFVGVNFLWHFSFVLLGICFVFAVMLASKGDFRQSGYFSALTVAAFVVSISHGWGGPQRFSGTMLAAVLVLIFRKTKPRFTALLLAPAVLLLAAAFNDWRTNHIWREPENKAEIRFPLAIPGAKLIKTNANASALTVELRDIARQIRAAGKSYAMLPHLPVWWASSEQPNPLPVDWPNFTEIGGFSQPLVDRYLRALVEQRGESLIVVHKFHIGLLARGFFSEKQMRAKGMEHYVSEFVRRNFTKKGETRFFELYE